MKTSNKYINKRNGILLLVLFIVATFFFLRGGEDIARYTTTEAVTGSVVKEINVVGKIKPVKFVDLAFENGGRVSSVLVEVGGTVLRGSSLVSLDSADAYAKLQRALADLDTEKIALEELERWARTEDIAVQETRVINAQQSLLEAQKDLQNKIQDAFTKVDNAIRNDADQLFSNPQSPSPSLNITTPDNQLKTDIESSRVVIGDMLGVWEEELLSVDSTLNELKQSAVNAQSNLKQTKLLLDKIAFAVNSLTASVAITQTTIDAYKFDIASARTSINTALVNVTASEEKLSIAQSALSLAQRELDLKKAPATQADLAIQQARIKSKSALVDSFRIDLENKTLRSPFVGVVTSVDVKRGEIVTAGNIAVSLASESGFEIEAYITEADIAGVLLGNSAKFTLDAFDDDVVFSAKVIKIDPTETVIEGVSTYKTTFDIVGDSKGILSGMTADMDILVKNVDDVVIVPARAISYIDDGAFVKILANGIAKEVPVELGMRGSDGMIEVKSGVMEGDEIVLFENK